MPPVPLLVPHLTKSEMLELLIGLWPLSRNLSGVQQNNIVATATIATETTLLTKGLVQVDKTDLEVFLRKVSLLAKRKLEFIGPASALLLIDVPQPSPL